MSETEEERFHVENEVWHITSAIHRLIYTASIQPPKLTCCSVKRPSEWKCSLRKGNEGRGLFGSAYDQN